MAETILTIITVTRNCADTIERTLNSVRLSKTGVVEYIVVDGASTDGTLEILRKTDDIDRLVSEPDEGIYQAMNKGVALASGRFVLFINGDDELVPEGVKQVLAALPGCMEEIVCASTLVIGDEVNPTVVYPPEPSKLVYFDSIPHPSAFVRRDLLVQFPFREDLKIASDYDFFLRMYLQGKDFKIIPVQSAVHYRGGASSHMHVTKVETAAIQRQYLGWLGMQYHQIIYFFNRAVRKALRLTGLLGTS